MAKLGKIDFTVVDQAGDIVANAIVEIRKQGAYVQGTQIIGSPGGAVTVHSPGGIVDGDSVAIDAGTTPYVVTADPTTTTVTVLVTEDTTFNDGERLTPVTNLPSIYSDADEQETAPPANPFTTGGDAKFCNYLRGNYYDMKITGSGLTDTLVPDRYVAAEYRESNAGRPSGNAILDILNSPVTLDASDKFVSYQFGDVEKFSINGVGGFAAGAASSVTGALTVTAGIVVDTDGLVVTAGDGVFTAGDVTVTLGDINMGNTVSQLVPGLTSFAIRNNADSADNLLVEDAGDVTVRNDFTVLGAASIVGNIDAVVDVTASGDLVAAGGFRHQLTGWVERDTPANVTDLPLRRFDIATMLEVAPSRDGSVVGVSILINDARLTGTAEAEVTIDGVKTGLSATLDETNTLTHTATQAKDVDTFTAGQRIGVKLTTASWTPTTGDIEVMVEIEG